MKKFNVIIGLHLTSYDYDDVRLDKVLTFDHYLAIIDRDQEKFHVCRILSKENAVKMFGDEVEAELSNFEDASPYDEAGDFVITASGLTLYREQVID